MNDTAPVLLCPSCGEPLDLERFLNSDDTPAVMVLPEGHERCKPEAVLLSVRRHLAMLRRAEAKAAKDPERQRRGRNNRKRGRAIERRGAKALGGEADGRVAKKDFTAGPFALESKSTANDKRVSENTLLEYLAQATRLTTAQSPYPGVYRYIGRGPGHKAIEYYVLPVVAMQHVISELDELAVLRAQVRDGLVYEAKR